jgi:hypothetical protein
VRVDFAGGSAVANPELNEGFELVVNCDAIPPGETKPQQSSRAHLKLEQGKVVGVALEGASLAGADSLRVRLRDALELGVPLGGVGAQRGGKLRVRVSVWHGGLPVDALPLQGAIDLDLISERDLLAEAY